MTPNSVPCEGRYNLICQLTAGCSNHTIPWMTHCLGLFCIMSIYPIRTWMHFLCDKVSAFHSIAYYWSMFFTVFTLLEFIENEDSLSGIGRDRWKSWETPEWYRTWQLPSKRASPEKPQSITNLGRYSTPWKSALYKSSFNCILIDYQICYRHRQVQSFHQN